MADGLGPGEGTWRCMICKDERPDALISVAHQPLKGFVPSFPDTRANVKYCNDRPACIAAATAPDSMWSVSDGVVPRG